MKYGLGLAGALAFLKEAVVNLLFFYLPVHLNGAGFSGAQIGSLMGAYTLTGMALLFPSGALSDGLSARLLIAAGFLVAGAAQAGLALAGAYTPLLLLFIGMGLADNLARTALQTSVFKTLPDDRVGALAAFNFTRCAGAATGLLAGALFLIRHGFRPLFLIAAALSLLGALLAPRLAELPARFMPLSAYRDGFLRRDVLLFSASMFLFAFHWGAEGTSYALFVRHNLGLDWTGTGLFIAIPIFILAASSFRVAAAIRRSPDFGRLLIFGLFLSGIGHMAMIVPVVWAAFVIRILHEIGDAVVGVVMLYGMSEFFPADRVGGLSALFALVNTVGSFLGALAYGPLGAARGYQWPLFVSGLLSLLAIGPALLFRAARRSVEIPLPGKERHAVVEVAR